MFAGTNSKSIEREHDTTKQHIHTETVTQSVGPSYWKKVAKH